MQDKSCKKHSGLIPMLTVSPKRRTWRWEQRASSVPWSLQKEIFRKSECLSEMLLLNQAPFNCELRNVGQWCLCQTSGTEIPLGQLLTFCTLVVHLPNVRKQRKLNSMSSLRSNKWRKLRVSEAFWPYFNSLFVDVLEKARWEARKGLHVQDTTDGVFIWSALSVDTTLHSLVVTCTATRQSDKFESFWGPLFLTAEKQRQENTFARLQTGSKIFCFSIVVKSRNKYATVLI